MSFWDPYTIVLAVSLVVSLSVYYKVRAADAYLKSFPPFLLSTLLAEVVGYYLNVNHKNNIWLYNFFSTFEFCFYMVAISFIIVREQMKKNIRIVMIIYALVAIFNILFIQQLEAFHTVTYSLGSLLVVASCIYYFFELFKYPKSVKLSYTPAFWICSGLLFFYCCAFSLFGLYNYWSGISRLVMKNFQQIVYILNVFLYSLFTIAFLCIRTRKYTLLPS
jgi:hypothetical protein